MNRPSIFWIDALKAICMLGVYICHSEAYSGYNSVALGYWVRPFYVNAFFFVSGYLFFIKYLKDNDILQFAIRGGKIALQNLFYRLVWPTLLFSTIVYIPKMAFHGGQVGWMDYLIDVFGGVSYWFTSALVVSQLLLVGVLMLMNGRSMWSYVAVCIPLFLLGTYQNGLRMDDEARNFFPWFYQTGMEYTLLMALGGLYKVYEDRLARIGKYVVAIATIVYVSILWISWESDYSLIMIGLSGHWNAWGLVAVVSGVALVIVISKCIPRNRGMEYVGRHSIVLYFFSGVYPAMVGAMGMRLFPDGGYAMTLCVVAISFLLGLLTTYLVNRYLPLMTDLRKLKYSNGQ